MDIVSVLSNQIRFMDTNPLQCSWWKSRDTALCRCKNRYVWIHGEIDLKQVFLILPAFDFQLHSFSRLYIQGVVPSSLSLSPAAFHQSITSRFLLFSCLTPYFEHSLFQFF